MIEGSIPDETNKKEGYWADIRHRSSDRSTDHDLRLDRPAGAQGMGGHGGGNLCDLRRNPRDGRKSDRLHGAAGLSGLGMAVKRGIPIVCVPGCPVQPDNIMETLLYLLHMAAGRAPMIPLDEALRPTWLFGQTVHEGCDRGGYLRAGRIRRGIRIAAVHREAGMLGPGGAMQRGKRGLDGRNRRDVRTWEESASAAPCRDFPTNSCRS